MLAEQNVRAGARPPPRAADLGRRLALSASALLVCLALAELAVRALGLAPPRFAETRHLESSDKRTGLDLYPSDPDDRFPLDLSTSTAREPFRALRDLDRWAARAPHAVAGHYSAELCRVPHAGDALPPRTPGVHRIVVVGDSFAEGQGVPYEATFGARLATRLGPGHEVIVCGRRGYDFALDPREAHGLGRFVAEHVEDADVVLYAMTLNDPARSPAFAAQQTYVDDWIVDRRRMLEHDGLGPPPLWSSRLLALVEDRLEALRIGAATERWYRDMVQAPNADGWRSTLDQLASLEEALRGEGRALLVALWPLLVRLESAAGYPFGATHARIVDDLEARGLDALDTLPAFVGARAEALWVHEIDHHPNADAHQRFAEAVAPRIREALARARATRESPSP